MSSKRYASIIVKNKNGETLVDTKGEHRVVFAFHAGVDGKPNEGSFRIYGLSDADENAVKIAGETMQLIAGTDERNNLLFSGDVVSAFSAVVDQQAYVQLSAVDGDAFFSGFVSLSIGAGETIGGMVEKAVRGCSEPLEIGFISPSAYKVSLARGQALFGSPMDIIRAAAKSLNATAYVQNGRFYLLCAGDSLSSALQIMEEDLQGVPVVDSWYALFKLRMETGLNVGQFASFAPAYGLGTYRVVSIDGNGDTRDGDWCLNVTAMAQSQDKPAMTALTTNIWR